MNENYPTKRFSWGVVKILLSLVVVLLALGLSIIFHSSSLATRGQAGAVEPQQVATTTHTDTGYSFTAPGKPVRIIIPAIGVDAHIQSVGLSQTGTGNMMDIPTNFTDVAWYNKGPIPGMPGSAVIDGHFDGKNVPRAVFYDLGNLKPNDLVDVVDEHGTISQFRVVGSSTYAYDATTTDIFSSDTSKARLNLITCAGDWIKSQKLYDKRIVVFTELVTME